jgi:hypothetical protein
MLDRVLRRRRAALAGISADLDAIVESRIKNGRIEIRADAA